MPGNETINTIPNAALVTFQTLGNLFWDNELPAIMSRYLPGRFVRSGGLHGTSGSRVTAAFATEAFTELGNRVTADNLGGAVSIDYGAMGASGTVTCWTIISAQAGNSLGNFQRVGTSNYFVNVGETPEPPLPSDSVWLMKVTITTNAITAVEDRRIPSSLVRNGVIDITDSLYGADPWGVSNASPAVQAAVNLHRVLQYPIYVPTAPVGYRIDTVIDMTDMTGQLLMYGDGSLAPTFGRALVAMSQGSIFLGNTGDGKAVFDCLGSNNTLFRDLNICTFGQSTPSEIGFLFGTSTTSPAIEAPGGANNSLENVAIQMQFAANNSCPVYYVSGTGLSHYLNVWTLAVHGFILSATNVLSVTSLYATPGSAIGVDGVCFTGCNLLGYGAGSVLWLENCHNMRLDQLYVATIFGGAEYAGIPYPLRINNCVDIKIDVECDYFPSVLITEGAIIGIELRGSTFPNLTPIPATAALIAFFSGTSVQKSLFQVEPVMGAKENFHYTSNGENASLDIILSSSFGFHLAVSENIALFNMTNTLPKPFFNLRFDGTAEGGVYDFRIEGVTAGAGTMRYWENGVLEGSG
jgi:hypothetical protein